MKRILFFLFGAFLICSVSMAEVWKVSHAWDLEWEKKYVQWIEDEVTIDLMKSADIAVDCADLCYFVRAIFARNHGLPFMASDAYGNQISHALDSWNRLPVDPVWYKDRRFHAFLIRLRDHVSTKSFPHNTYPVKLCAETVQPGLMIYENLIASHACFVGRVRPENLIPVIYFEASVPMRVSFKKTTILGVYIYPPEVPKEHSGIVRWNWPREKNGRWTQVADEEMPYYSLELYEEDYPYRQSLSKPLNQIAKSASKAERMSLSDYIQELVTIFEEEVEYRAQIVREAQSILEKNPEDFQSDGFDYEYNTESRDDRLFKLIRQIWHAVNEYEIPRRRLFQAMQSIFISISPSLPDVNLYYLFITVDNRWIHSDAYARVEKRWGMQWDQEKKQWIFNKEHTIEDLLPRYDMVTSKPIMHENYVEFDDES